MENNIFQRHEIKYMLDSRQRAIVEQAFHGRMLPDPHGESTICNIYYDTPDHRLIRESLEKPVYKEKLRVRAYNLCSPEGEVFVELKKKYDGVVYKRRLQLPHRQAMDALESGAPLPAEGQIAREIEAFRRFYGPTLGPAMALSYEREAFYPVDGTDFRLTLDENLLWRTDRPDLSSSCRGRLILPRETVLMELKTPGGIPLWMVKFLSERGIRQVSVSKYGLAYLQMVTENRVENKIIRIA